MKYRPLGRTGWNVSEISFGAWAIGGTWGSVDDQESLATLHKAIDCGVNFIDTADVYGDGRSERLVGQVVRERGNTRIYVATKFGRRLNPHSAEGYNETQLESFLDRSLTNLGVETIDLVQLHCPPTSVYASDAVFEICDRFVQKGKLRHYGVSVEKIEEAMQAIEYPGVQSVQIIYNVFRQRPAETFLPAARAKQVGVLARLPLSSGMLTGRMTRETRFEPDDHRAGNREGQWFDKGETFSGVPFDVGLEAVEALRRLVPDRMTLAQFALKWILMEEAMTAAIPGGRRPGQVEENCAASELPDLPAQTLEAVRQVYDERIRAFVHGSW